MAATIVGPVKGGVHGWPFSASMADLEAAGYVETEFFLEGEATAYELAPDGELGIDGHWAVQPAGSAPFRTRLLVVRPADPRRFNGTVIVNWQNVTAGFEIGTAQPDLVAEGYAWVGVSTQRAGIHGIPGTEAFALRGWDPERYGSLDHPGDDFSYDIFTQAAQALGPERSPVGPDPLDGFPVARLLASGASQSAIRLRTYINAVHPLARALDGYFLKVDFGLASIIDAHRGPSSVLETDDPLLTVQGAMTLAQIRDDLDVPVMVFNSETEAPTTYPVRQPDNDRFRLWEVTGTSHSGGTSGTDEMQRQFEREGIADAFGPEARGQVAPPDPNVLSYREVERAAMDHVQRWLITGTPPPSLPRIEFDPGPPETIRRDQWGNALGGIHIPDFAVPTAAHLGTREGTDILGSLSGATRPFSSEQLKERYTGIDAYLTAYEQAINQGVLAGYLRAEDAPAMKARGAEAAAALISW